MGEGGKVVLLSSLDCFFFNKLMGLLHHIIEGSEVFRSDGWNLIIVNDFTFIIVKIKVNF